MDKRTILAVVLSVVVISGSMILQGVLFPREPTQPAVAEQDLTEVESVQQEAPAAGTSAGAAAQGASATDRPAAGVLVASGPVAAVEEPRGSVGLRERTVELSNDVMTVAFSTRGAVVTSVKLHRHLNRDGTPVEMVLSGDTGQYPFAIRFGDHETPAVNEVFAVEGPWPDSLDVVFSRDFVSPGGVPFTLRKTFLLKPAEYMIEIRVELENSVNDYLDLDFDGIAYTLSYGPQIGPEYLKLDRRNELREYIYREAGKKKSVRMPREGVTVLEERPTWTSITGKYFTVAAVPDATQYRITYDVRPLPGVQDHSSMHFSRPLIKATDTSDIFRFYVGPKQREVLARYDDPEKNGFRLDELHLTDTISSSILIGWLSTALGFVLKLLYGVIPNYGVAIILLTILIKIALYPLSRKSFESTARMQKLNPKIEEIRQRYKGKPELMNKELAAFYKKEGVNPMGGCLPMLMQLPIFFAFYNLLNTQFELRGAPFITPWISDLSGPETVVAFGFTIPLLGWSDLKILPFVMLATTFLQTKVSQTPDTGQSNTKILTYAMPIFFFFILYNMPSGLVLYWTVQNIIGIVQQLGVNYLRSRKNGSGGPAGKKKRTR